MNYQHEPRVLNFFARKGVKVVHGARYDPRGSPIEAGFAQVRATLTPARQQPRHLCAAPRGCDSELTLTRRVSRR